MACDVVVEAPVVAAAQLRLRSRGYRRYRGVVPRVVAPLCARSGLWIMLSFIVGSEQLVWLIGEVAHPQALMKGRAMQDTLAPVSSILKRVQRAWYGISCPSGGRAMQCCKFTSAQKSGQTPQVEHHLIPQTPARREGTVLLLCSGS